MKDTKKVWKTGKTPVITITKEMREMEGIKPGDWVEIEITKIKQANNEQEEPPKEIPQLQNNRPEPTEKRTIRIQ